MFGCLWGDFYENCYYKKGVFEFFMSILLEVFKYIIKIKGVMRVFSYLWVCFFNIWKVYKQKFEFFLLKSVVFMRIDTFKNYFLVWKGVIRMFGGWVKICGVCGYAFFNIWKLQVKLCQVTLFNTTESRQWTSDIYLFHSLHFDMHKKWWNQQKNVWQRLVLFQQLPFDQTMNTNC